MNLLSCLVFVLFQPIGTLNLWEISAASRRMYRLKLSHALRDKNGVVSGSEFISHYATYFYRMVVFCTCFSQ